MTGLQRMDYRFSFAVLSILVVLGFLLLPSVSRIVFGLLLMFFAPGFAIVYAFFDTAELDAIERAALSLGLSICVVVLDGLVLNFTPGGFSPGQIVLSLCAITAAFAGIGLLKRRR